MIDLLDFNHLLCSAFYVYQVTNFQEKILNNVLFQKVESL